MGLTSRRPRPLDRGAGQVRDSRLVIIAAEGRLTEAQYFSMFRSTRVQLKVLPTPAGDSAPEAVLARLADFRAEYELTADDALWLMVDVDRWGEKTLARVCREARSRGFELAISRTIGHATDPDPRRRLPPSSLSRRVYFP